MAAVDPEIVSAIRYYRDHLIGWYETEYGHRIDNFSDNIFTIIASFYGGRKLLQEYQAEMAAIWCGVSDTEDVELDGLDLSHSQWGYGDPTAKTCLNTWNVMGINRLF